MYIYIHNYGKNNFGRILAIHVIKAPDYTCHVTAS